MIILLIVVFSCLVILVVTLLTYICLLVSCGFRVLDVVRNSNPVVPISPARADRQDLRNR